MAKLLSDQVSQKEIEVVLRELNSVMKNGVSGDVVELGCYVGTTSVHLAEILKGTDHKLYLYDSFAGLPDKTKEDASPLGGQFKPGELLATRKQLMKNLVRAQVPIPKIKKSWFSDLVDGDIPEKIMFAFLDGDYYGSIIDSLSLIWPHLCSGSVVVIDDYANESLPGVARAVDEWIDSHRSKIKIEQSLAIINL